MRKPQEGSEMQEEEYRKSLMLYFSLSSFLEKFLEEKKYIYKHLLCARHSIRCFHVILFTSDNAVEEVLLSFSNNRN